MNILWAGDVYLYNVPSFNVLTVTLGHIVISFVDQGVFQKVGCLHARQPRDSEPCLNFTKSHLSMQVEVAMYLLALFPVSPLLYFFVGMQEIAWERGYLFIEVGHFYVC